MIMLREFCACLLMFIRLSLFIYQVIHPTYLYSYSFPWHNSMQIRITMLPISIHQKLNVCGTYKLNQQYWLLSKLKYSLIIPLVPWYSFPNQWWWKTNHNRHWIQLTTAGHSAVLKVLFSASLAALAPPWRSNRSHGWLWMCGLGFVIGLALVT